VRVARATAGTTGSQQIQVATVVATEMATEMAIEMAIEGVAAVATEGVAVVVAVGVEGELRLRFRRWW
jgi:hypothetical protein